MKTMKRAGLVALGVGAFALLSGFGWGHHRRGHHMDEERARQVAAWFLDDALDELDATDAQRAKLEPLAKARLEEGLSMMKAHRENRRELTELLLSEKPDRERLHAIVDARADELRRFAHDTADDLLEAHAVLTPEQRREVAERVREHHERHAR